MTHTIKVARNPRVVLAATFLILAGLCALAYGQIAAARPPGRHFEYLHQEILASEITRSLNDLDAQGWEIFQLIPSWQVKNENGDTVFAPRAYEIFGRKIVSPK